MTADDGYERKVQKSVTLFIRCGDDFLFLKRNLSKKVDPGRLNGVGGRVEAGENYLDAAIREAGEETGYVVDPKRVRLSGIVSLQGGYETDWLACFFNIEVADKNIPLGESTKDGELIWLDKDKVLESDFELVDDLNYCFKEVVKTQGIFFMNAKLDENQKIFEISMSKIE